MSVLEVWMHDGFLFDKEERRCLVYLKDVPSSVVLFGIILYYPYDRFSERELVDFMRRVALEVPDPFASGRFDRVAWLLEELQCGPIRSERVNGDEDGWSKNEEFIRQRQKTLMRQNFLPEFGSAFRILAERFVKESDLSRSARKAV